MQHCAMTTKSFSGKRNHCFLKSSRPSRAYVPESSQRDQKSPAFVSNWKDRKPRTKPKQSATATKTNNKGFLIILGISISVCLICDALMGAESLTNAGYLLTGNEVYHTRHPKTAYGKIQGEQM